MQGFFLKFSIFSAFCRFARFFASMNSFIYQEPTMDQGSILKRQKTIMWNFRPDCVSNKLLI